MARIGSTDPLDKFRWQVEIPGFQRLGFYSVETPASTISTREYKEGGAHTTPRQIVDSVSFKPIAFTRGVTGDRSFANWAKQPLNAPQITTKQEYRKNISITHYDRSGRPVVVYKLFNCIPIEFQPASDFSADADDGLSIERLVIKYEGFTADVPSITDRLLGAAEQALSKLF